MPDLNRQPTAIQHEASPILRLGVYAEGGVGKTTLALTFPRPLVVDTDGGLEGDAVVNVDGDEWSPDKWQDLNALYAYVKERITKAAAKDKPYGTIVLDSIDTLCTFLRHEAENMASPGRAANRGETQLVTADQQDYGKVERAVDVFLTKLRVLSHEQRIHIVITSAVRDLDPDKGRTKRSFDCQPAVEHLLCKWLNTYGELDFLPTKDEDEEHRVLWTKSSDRVRKNKTRWGALRPGVTDPTFTKIVGLIEGTWK